MRKIFTILVAACVALGALLVGPAPAQAAGTNTYFSVLTPSGKTGKKVLDIREYSTANRGVAQLWDLRTSGEVRNQRWTATEISPGSDIYEIKNQLSGLCLDKSQDTPDANGNAVYQYACLHTANQRWEFVTISGCSNYCLWGELKNTSDGRCLDVPGADWATATGRALVVWECNGNWNQRWNIW